MARTAGLRHDRWRRPELGSAHFPPSVRPFGDGELVLIDAGAEVHGYASDITRTYPAAGRFTPAQAEL